MPTRGTSSGHAAGKHAAVKAKSTTGRPVSGDMSVRDAGRKGGETTSQEVRSGELPKDFYQQIGHKGGETVKKEVASGELPHDHYSQIGHKGGQKVKDLIAKGKAKGH